MATTAVKEWWDEGKHKEIAATYLAIPDTDNYKDDKYAKQAVDNLKRVMKLSEAMPLGSKYIEVSCKDKWEMCKRNVEGVNRPIAGYAKNWMHVDGHHYDIVMCPPWFLVDTPDQLYNTWKDQPQGDISMDYLENDAGKLLHEFMHITFISEDRPEIKDKLYQGKRAYTAPVIADWVLNYKARAVDVVANADSYTQFVNAIHFKNKFGFLPPPERENPLKVNKECYDGGNRYVDKDLAEKWANDFCPNAAEKYKQGERSSYDEQYAEDKPDHVEFAAKWAASGRWSAAVFEDKCLDVLPDLVTGCDGASRWKTGGVSRFQDGDDDIYTFMFTPKHDRPSPVPSEAPGWCDVYFKFPAPYNEFYIYGGLWAGNDHGQGQLLPNVRRCGVVTDWEFEYYEEPDKDGYEWKAWGKIPIGAQQWGCIANAVKDSHGPEITCGGK
ncbi:hypothetical protein BDV95DRAFT_621072 [Massariosphaeria phaeospora]|uniref:Uncharacterized protein n=1 Tax=Massariosphaeria phaeospora TaxID=100035 RepID=A0A7C8M5R7_9PLEO|nr:hypothetical protein BDV95DRAFT_621072 [Massariosphaeria phaeospora]